jgi:hypothetical protein
MKKLSAEEIAYQEERRRLAAEAKLASLARREWVYGEEERIDHLLHPIASNPDLTPEEKIVEMRRVGGAPFFIAKLLGLPRERVRLLVARHDRRVELERRAASAGRDWLIVASKRSKKS